MTIYAPPAQLKGVEMKCSVLECGKDHFKQYRFLKPIHAIEAWEHVRDYMAMMLEIGLSMRNDADNNRKGAFITRFRHYKECYFKGLWVGLMATPEEIVHDASAERPWFMLAELAKNVSKTIFDEGSKLSENLADPGKTIFTPLKVLNSSTHLTALFLLFRSQLSDADAKSMYVRCLKDVEMEAAHLKYVFEALKAGKDRKDIIDGIRNMRKKR
jgi:hypothetical protein